MTPRKAADRPDSLDLDDILSLDEAGELIGRSPEAMRKAALRGSLETKMVGRTYITTRDAAARYAARVAVKRRVARPR